MPNEPSSCFSSTEKTNNLPVTVSSTLFWVGCVDWIARCSAGNIAEFIGKRQSTYSRADTENHASQGKDDDKLLYWWLLVVIIFIIPEESHE